MLRVLWIGVGLALLAACACVAAGAHLQSMHYTADLAGQFAIQALFGSVAIAAVFLLARYWRLAVLAGIVAGAALAAVWPFADAIPRCEEGEARHRVMFLNVWGRNEAPEEALRAIRESGAAVVMLAEVTASFAGQLDALDALYPFRTPCGRGALCRLMILSTLPFKDVSGVLAGRRGPPEFGAIRVAAGAHDLTIVGLHLTRPWPFDRPIAQTRQAAGLIEGLKIVDGPLVVVGDFNAVTWGAIVRKVEDEIRLSALSGFGTWPANLPALFRLPIDQAFVGGSVSCASKRNGPPAGSDHLPIILDLGF